MPHLGPNDLRIGVRLIDNDPRNGGVVVEVSKLDDTHVFYVRNGRTNRIRKDRIWPAGAQVKSGWSLVA